MRRKGLPCPAFRWRVERVIFPRFLFRRINLLRTFGRSRGHPQIEFRRTSSWKARSLKWRTSEIGPTLPSRRTALHLNFPFPCSLAPANRSVSASFSACGSNTEQFLHRKKRLPRSSSPLVQRRNQSQRSACRPPRGPFPTLRLIESDWLVSA